MSVAIAGFRSRSLLRLRFELVCKVWAALARSAPACEIGLNQSEFAHAFPVMEQASLLRDERCWPFARDVASQRECGASARRADRRQ